MSSTMSIDEDTSSLLDIRLDSTAKVGRIRTRSRVRALVLKALPGTLGGNGNTTSELARVPGGDDDVCTDLSVCSGVYSTTLGIVAALPTVACLLTLSGMSKPTPPPLIHSPSGAEYHARVKHQGWVHKYTSRLRARLVRRFLRLNNSILTNAHDENSDPTWVISVSNSLVRSNEDKCTVSIHLSDRELRFVCEDAASTLGWVTALRRASRCNISDFYTLGAQLGFGSFGAVRIGTCNSSGKTYAVKVVERSANAKEREFITREMAVMLSVSHPNLVRTIDIFDEEEQIFCVMEYVKGGDLFDYIANRGSALDECTSREITRQMLKAVSYLHCNNIVHRDIKPENVLMTSLHPLHVQLTDFGFANFIDPESESPHADMKSVVGTGCYMSPEVIDARGHGPPVDIFAIGVVMFKMIAGSLPFEGETLKECYRAVMGTRLTFDAPGWARASPHAEALCGAMLRVDPSQRPTAEEALSNAWFAEVPALSERNDRESASAPDVVDASNASNLVQVLSAPLFLSSPDIQSYDSSTRGSQPNIRTAGSGPYFKWLM